MRKISTLALMAFFCCLSAAAQVVLGDIKFSVKDGAKLNPTTGKITVTFPNVTGVEDPSGTSFVLTGAFNDSDFDGVEGTFAAGVTFDLSEFELQPSTDYALKITSVKVDGTELAAEGGYTLNFKTRGAERKMSWTFAIDDESLALIQEEATANTESDEAKYIDLSGSKGPRFYVPARNYEEIMLPNSTALPMTEDLLFKFGAKVFYVGGQTGNFANQICFNGNDQFMTIPDCQEGDVITFNANRATKYDASKNKFTLIQAMNGAAIAPEGFVSEGGVQDSVQLGSSFANFKFEVQAAGDITFRFSNCLLKSVSIEEAQEKLPCKYNVVAAYADSVSQINLTELVGETEGVTGSTVKVNYPYWLVDAEGNAYTHGKKGNEFVEAFDLKGDTTFVVNYGKTAFEGVVFLSEGEDLPGAALCTSANAAVRSSMAKAAYFAENVKLCTLQPGTYKVRTVLFDANKTPGYILNLMKGAEGDTITFTATATNFDEQESDLIEITEPTDITLLASGGENTGVDIIMIYASTDAPEDPESVADIKGGAQKYAARKVAKNGRILIQTAAGTFNVVGVQVK